MVESFANTSNENAAHQVDGEFAVTTGDKQHDSRSLENIFGLPGQIEESSSTTQAGYELTRNNWDLVAQAEIKRIIIDLDTKEVDGVGVEQSAIDLGKREE